METATNLRIRKNVLMEAWSSAPIDELFDRIADVIEGASTAALVAVAGDHASEHFRQGLTIDALVADYAQLRECIARELPDPAVRARLDHAIDVAIGAGVKQFLAQREQLRERFMGVLAHDLRTPLACVTMATEMLMTEKRTDHERSLLELIGDATDRMQRMVTDVLAWARSATGEAFPVSKCVENLDEIIRDVIDETRVVYGGNCISYDATGDLRCELDRDRVHQVVTNLVRNAIEHGAGSAHIVAAETDTGETVVLCVRNQGGLRSPNSSDIIDPFRRRKRPTHARGLGLYIVDQITQSHGATIELASTFEETAITIRWPTGRTNTQHP